MRTFMAGLLAVAALVTLSVSSVEARGCRGGGFFHRGGCNNSCGSGVFHGGGCSTCGGTVVSQCGPNGCNVGGTTWAQPQIVTEGAEYIPQAAPQTQVIQVRDSQGRIYYLVPQNQYEKLAAPK